MFDVKHSNQSEKFLRKADKTLAKRITEMIERLREEPIIHDTKRIEGSHGVFRVRVGDHRVLYEVDYKNNLIGIIKIDKRSKVY